MPTAAARPQTVKKTMNLNIHLLLERYRKLHRGSLGRLWVRYRTTWSTVWYGLLGAAALTGAFLLRFEGQIPLDDRMRLFAALPVAILLRIISVLYFEVPRGLPQYVGIVDVIRILKAASVGTLSFVVVVVLLFGHGFPRSIFIIDYLLTVAAYGGSRFALHMLWKMTRPPIAIAPGRNTLILGAGSTGELALKSIENDFYGVFSVVGFLDDSLSKRGMTLHGYPILGGIEDARRYIEELAVRDVIIAIPSASKEMTRHIVEMCASRNVSFRIVPPFQDVITGRGSSRRIREVRLEDILGRDPVRLNLDVVRSHLAGRRVLITGAGGSIGSELVRQIAKCNPGLLLLLDMAETPLFEINQELQNLWPDVKRVSIFADIKHGDLLDKIFDQYKPDLVYHAAAYKHVPMNEAHPVEAVFNNVLGTLNVVKSSVRSKVDKFILISTDKAVRPLSVMGATKRCAELLLQHMQGQGPKFIAVRFGNVLESAGSVAPIFRRQIARGGPLTVTHPDVERYFMTIPESVELVLQAGAIGMGAEVFILDMGKPIKIVDLARNMIELSGLEVGKDIEILFTGLRPGEKLTEELIADGENVTPTSIPKVSLHVAARRTNSHTDFLKELEALEKAAMNNDDAQALAALWEIIHRHDGNGSS